jgi:hypothetical protein
LVGCAGEAVGTTIGTALVWGNLPTTLLAVALAFLFGYTLTSIPLLRSGIALAAVVPVALAADTVSITIMEAIDNLVVWLVPGAIDAGLGGRAVLGVGARRLRRRFRSGVPRQPQEHRTW